MSLNVRTKWATSPLPVTLARSPGRSRSTRSINDLIPSSGRRLARTSAAFTPKITTSPTASTTTSRTATGADTVAGESTRAVAPTTKTSPLSRKTLHTSADTGERMMVCSPVARCGTSRTRPSMATA